MVRSWSTQISPALLVIQRQLTQLTQLNVNSHNSVQIRQLLDTLHRIPDAWICDEGFECGIINSVFSILATQKSKYKRVVMCDIIKELLLYENSISRSLVDSLLSFVHSCIEQYGNIRQHNWMKLKKTIQKHIFVSTSSLSTLLSLSVYIPETISQEYDTIVEQLIGSLLAGNRDSKEVCSCPPCQCSYCLIHRKSYYITRKCQSLQTESFLTVWKRVLHCLPIVKAGIMTEQYLHYVISVIQNQPHFHCTLLSLGMVHECCHLLGINALLDVIDELWKKKQSANRLLFISSLIAHSPLLDITDVLHILLMIIEDTKPNERIITMFLHILLIRCSCYTKRLEDIVLKQLEKIICWLDAVEENIWECISYQLRHDCAGLLSQLHLSVTLCCSRWCIHICNTCQNDQSIVLSTVQCVICSIEQPNHLHSLFYYSPHSYESNCLWRPPQSIHVCPRCRMNCCSDGHHSCLCRQGIYSSSYDFSSSESSEESDGPDEKRRRILEFQMILEKTQRTAHYASSLGNDVLLRIMRYLPLLDMVEMSCCSKDLLALGRDNWVWQYRYLTLYSEYQCQHKSSYKHNYLSLFRRRVVTVARFGDESFICQFCGCNRHFKQLSIYIEHITKEHC